MNVLYIPGGRPGAVTIRDPTRSSLGALCRALPEHCMITPSMRAMPLSNPEPSDARARSERDARPRYAGQRANSRSACSTLAASIILRLHNRYTTATAMKSNAATTELIVISTTMSFFFFTGSLHVVPSHTSSEPDSEVQFSSQAEP
eukprot:scaffold138594_cov28-Tisochrysis_lutea.AAC.2